MNIQGKNCLNIHDIFNSVIDLGHDWASRFSIGRGVSNFGHCKVRVFSMYERRLATWMFLRGCISFSIQFFWQGRNLHRGWAIFFNTRRRLTNDLSFPMCFLGVGFVLFIIFSAGGKNSLPKEGLCPICTHLLTLPGVQ